MKKLTRKHFSRKFVAIGLSAFLGIGLVSTGFAAWVMSSNASNETESNVTVATLSDVSLSFEDVTIVDDASIVFGAKKDDRSGRLVSDGNEDECLSITVSFTLENADILGQLTAKFELPASIQAAVNQGYLVAPESATTDGIVIYNPTTSVKSNALTVTPQADNTIDFEYVISFTWGEKFGNMNPSEYYDEHADGKAVSDSDMGTQMTAFRTLIAGNADNTVATIGYTFTLTATANTSM